MSTHHRVRTRGAIRFLTVLFCIAALPAFAETGQGPKNMPGGQIEIYGIIEDFSWEEFDPAGSSLLKESGRRGGVGFAYAVDFNSGLTLRPRLEVVGGQVDYDGQTPGRPEISDTDYVGARFEADLGGRLGGRFTVEPFGGIGIRTWWRDVNDGIDGSGAYAAGYTEEWSLLYGRLGLRAVFRVSDSLSLFFEGAAVLPVFSEATRYMTDDGYLEDPVLEPEAGTTYFAEAGVRFHIFRISAFYETLRFDASDPEAVYNVTLSSTETVSQPRSEADLYGVRLGASF